MLAMVQNKLSNKINDNIPVKNALHDQPSISKNTQKCHSNRRVSCSSCRLSSLCLPIALNTDEINQLDEIVQRSKPLGKGDHLYRGNDLFKSIYAVRSGSFKSYTLSADGNEQVNGFYMPGEIIGIDGISSLNHVSSAIALERSSVCEIPFSRLEDLSRRLPALQHHFFQIMGKEIAKDQKMLALLSCNSAEQRVASIFLSFSARNDLRHLSPTKLHLTMTRAEIGNYLGITVETVSRIISRLHSHEILHVDNKNIEIKDLDKLRHIANIAE